VRERAKSYWFFVTRRAARDPATMIFLGLTLCIVASAILAPWIAPSDPSEGSALRRLAQFGTPGHSLGTDELGRDMLSRILYGGRTSLLLGISPVFFALLIGGSLGVLAGFVGGWTNMITMRTMDVFYAFPSVLLAIGLSGALGAGPRNLLVAVTVVLIPQIARVAESVTTQLRSYGYIEAARASGASTLMIIRYHVLRNVLGPILVFATSLVSVSLIISAGLNFLGFGVQPPTPAWGSMLSESRDYLYVAWWLAAFPGAALAVTALGINLVGDWLRDVLDPKFRV
jgi:peptide/nickel transport system permease protein